MTTGVLMREEWLTICKCGELEVKVDPEAVIGGYAVHRSISRGKPIGPGYTVTHRAGGLAVWHVREFSLALAVAKWLDDQKVLPETADGLVLWKEALSLTGRAFLVSRLSAIAPREYVVSE